MKVIDVDLLEEWINREIKRLENEIKNDKIGQAQSFLGMTIQGYRNVLNFISENQFDPYELIAEIRSRK